MRIALLLLLAAAALLAAEYSTYIGDGNPYQVAAVAVDAAGNTYITGRRLFSTADSSPGSFSLSDVFVAKVDAAGALAFTATLGGKAWDSAAAIALDPAGNIYVGGSTSSPNFPLRNAFRSQFGPGFLVKLSPDASRIVYSTYFPGSIAGIAVDSAQNVYLTGVTYDPSFPTTSGLPAGPIRSGLAGTTAAFLTKLAAAGDRVLYSMAVAGVTKNCGSGSSCFLSTRYTSGAAVALDAAGNAYLAGNTDTTDLPTTPGAFARAGTGAYLAKVDAAGSSLMYLTYIGAGAYPFSPFANPANRAAALAVDAAGNAYLAGSTNDPKFPATPGAWQRTYSGPAEPPSFPLSPTDAYALKLSPDGRTVLWASFLGGPSEDAAQAIALDSAGNAWLTGVTTSASFPNPDGWSQGPDFLAAFNASGSTLTSAARYPEGAVAAALAVDPAGTLHAAGSDGIVSALAPGRLAARRVFGVANAALGSLTGRVAPGEVISLFGPHIGPAAPVTATPANGLLPTSLGPVQVLIGGIPAPLLYAADSQINAIVPFGVEPGSAAGLRLQYSGVALPEFRLAVLEAVPEIFRNPDGTAAALNQDGTLNSAEHPAPPGSVVAIWATGIGRLPLADGAIATGAQEFYCCRITGLDVLYGGSAPTLPAGIVQVNFRAPATPDHTFYLTARGQASAGARIFVTPQP